MKKRIKELYDLAVEHTAAMDNGERNQRVLNEICAEKFAELVIRECTGIVYEIGDYSNGLTRNKRSRNGLFASMIGQTIEKEFELTHFRKR